MEYPYTINITVSMEDNLAFQKDYILRERMPSSKKMTRNIILTILGTNLILALVNFLFTGNKEWTSVWYIAIGVCTILELIAMMFGKAPYATWFVLKHRVKSQVQRAFERKDSFNNGEPSRLTFEEEGLVEENNRNKQQIAWDNIPLIIQGKEHLFIYLSETIAFIIPLRQLTANQEEEILAILDDKAQEYLIPFSK
ncbi:hypothetical protein RU97_GL001011 [Enterococcus canis]|uniref:YcxB-like C-terminal domain-containing protein n=1 Tax=Enterococcus canis TaxID=214095 RepID=A0A1L8RI42_9ENTE|nr:YcxB family protein [Enterococcus canis]OJG19440.1 hypothetical protein RU97_GL001011 [Enterococcus canis]